MKSLWIPVLAMILLAGCKKDDRLDVDVSGIPAEVHVNRFDTLFYGGDPSRLQELKKNYPYLFPPSTPDSVWIKKMRDTLTADVTREVRKVFPDKLGVEDSLEEVFKHIKYYFPQWKEPGIITLYSDWNYMKRWYLGDTTAFLFLDNYLGKDNPLYKGIPLYIRQTMSKEYIPVDFARHLAEELVPPPRTKDFLSKMIYHGKVLYLTKAFIPFVHDSLLLGYSSEKWNWAVQNEKDVWLYFLDNNLLFKTDKKLDNRFLNPAPFSKFYTDIDNQSAGMIGRYTGYRIVQAYIHRTDADLRDLIRTPERKIFDQSKYKP